MLTETFAYLEMFKKKNNVISEAEDDEISLDEVEELADGIDDTKEPEEEKNIEKKEEKKTPPKIEKPAEKTEDKGEAEMKFSVDLATEFSNTVNQFTSVCAKIVETRVINKETSDKFYDLYSKIKCLADAASKTE
jgi:type I site-specific restriction-modification system R (restriction) subunit